MTSPHTSLTARQRQAALHAIDWLEKAINAVERYDYQASDHAVGIARRYIEEAERLTYTASEA